MLEYVERVDNLPTSTAQASLRDFPIDDEEDLADSVYLDSLYLHGGEMCKGCGQFPCIWDCNKEEYLNTLYSGRVWKEANVGEISNRVHRNRRMRNKSYQILSYLIDGRLGRDHRKALPTCVVNGVRNMFPAADGNYTGFHLSNAQMERMRKIRKKK